MVEALIPKETGVGFRMTKEEPPSTSKDLQELQKKLSLLVESIQNNSKVDFLALPFTWAITTAQMVAFMKSPVGQYLDRHPFMALTVLVFVVMSAIPVGFFLLIVVLTSLAAFVGVILLEGLVISVGGLSLLCVLCGLSFVSLAMSGTIIVSYVVVSSLVNYWFPPSSQVKPSTDHALGSKVIEALFNPVFLKMSHLRPETGHCFTYGHC
ncbi:lipid droplet assembly factor 1 isoform X1 [Mirounga angustirostris]|uniref:lipid droplet assembly factor 1 isoform X1 n=1 Tax=Mirounga angustirostris TaxID=9716 RepID=UPI00313C1FEB